MISFGPIIIITIIIIFILYFFSSPKIEYYVYIPGETDELNYPYYPYWNASTRHTRNMSYDLRGDVPIPSSQQVLLPFNMSSYAPGNYIPVM